MIKKGTIIQLIRKKYHKNEIEKSARKKYSIISKIVKNAINIDKQREKALKKTRKSLKMEFQTH